VAPALNQAVLAFAQAHLGQQVGDGECATLVSDAYAATGAVPFYDLGPSGPSDNYVWGNPVATLTAPGQSTAGILPGDVIQFSNVTLVHTTYGANGSWTRTTQTAPHHTAIVTGVSGGVISVIEQNVEGPGVAPNLVKTVQFGTIDLSDLQPAGTLWVYRPIALGNS
jgi:hypothetical protein